MDNLLLWFMIGMNVGALIAGIIFIIVAIAVYVSFRNRGLL